MLHYNEITFSQALARARVRDAAELNAIAAAIAAGNPPAPTRDIGDVLRQLSHDNWVKALSMWCLS